MNADASATLMATMWMDWMVGMTHSYVWIVRLSGVRASQPVNSVNRCSSAEDADDAERMLSERRPAQNFSAFDCVAAFARLRQLAFRALGDRANARPEVAAVAQRIQPDA